MRARILSRRIAGLTLVAWLLVTPVLAEEIVVKNDSFTGGLAQIVGDFVSGERAGARLTSPCNGTIVAVQILWLEGTPGHGQSLEQAIYIYADGTFPVPGPVLAMLEGPVMTPGYINEFRYLDEAGTIPINVPVTAGESFFVALEFYNPTDVGNGGPSVVRDLDGCQSGRNVLYAIPGGWYNFCFFLQGDLVIRAVIDCPGATGACCHATGVCENAVEESDCQDFGDVWHEGLTCAQITCTPRGACCRQGGCLQLVDEATCVGIGGVYAGHGSDCDDQVCVAGACCLNTGQCLSNFEFQCDALGGTFLGAGTSCTPNPCPQPQGACCIGTFCISNQTEAQCTGAGGDWVGPFTDCDPNPCVPTEGACCHPDGSCTYVTQANCSGTWQGTGTDCDPNPCPQPWCLGDMNCSGGSPTFDDIKYFSAAIGSESTWWAYFVANQGVSPPCPWLAGDYNVPRNGVEFSDIKPFAASIGQPCIAYVP